MSKLIAVWKTFNLIRKNAGMLKIVEDVFLFAKKAHEEGKPMLCRIAFVNMKDNSTVGDFISLWAGIGDANPIERCRQLRAQRAAIEEVLKTMSTKYNFSDQDRKDVDFLIQYVNL